MAGNVAYAAASFVWRNTILKWYRQGLVKKEERHWREHRRSYGRENSDKTFYVIRRWDYYCGLGSILLTTLQRIEDAIGKGYIPVVDMQNNFNIYLEREKIGKENSWEYYFEQPAGYDLKAIGRSRHVIEGAGTVPEKMFPYLTMDFLSGRSGELEYWQELTRKYIRFSPEAEAAIDQTYSGLFGEEERVLGVILRGTDYVQAKPKNHPIQPTPEEAVMQIERILAEQNCDKIFLATEDKEIYKVIKERFGDRVCTNKTDFLEYQGGSIGKEAYSTGTDPKAMGMEYLTTLAILSKCHCLCGGCVSGTVAALLLTKGYEYTYLFDLGIY